MDKENSKVPIFYSLAYHSMSFNKDDPNMCAKEFLEYLKKVGNIVTKDVSGQINSEVLRLTDDRQRRELMQAANLELTIEGVEDLFPNLLKSKEISREEIDTLLRKAANNKS